MGPMLAPWTSLSVWLKQRLAGHYRQAVCRVSDDADVWFPRAIKYPNGFSVFLVWILYQFYKSSLFNFVNALFISCCKKNCDINQIYFHFYTQAIIIQFSDYSFSCFYQSSPDQLICCLWWWNGCSQSEVKHTIWIILFIFLTTSKPTEKTVMKFVIECKKREAWAQFPGH